MDLLSHTAMGQLQFSLGLLPHQNHSSSHRASTKEYFMSNSSELHTAHQPATIARRGLGHFKMLQKMFRQI